MTGACWLAGLLAAAAPVKTGVLIAASDAASQGSPRLRPIAARLVVRGLESYVAADLVRPRPDAEQRLSRARKRTGEARDLSDRGKLKEALGAYQDALRAVEENASRDTHLRLLLEVLVEQGAVAQRLGDSATAEALFLRALALAPSHEPAGARVGGAALELFRQVKEVASGLPKGALSIDTGGLAGADVSVDFGAPLAPPFRAELAPGTHFVSVRAQDRDEVVVRALVRPREDAPVFVRPPVPGDPAARARAFDGFESGEASSRARIVASSGLRFLLLASLEETSTELAIFEPGGLPFPAPAVKIAAGASDAEIDRALDALLLAASETEPTLAPERRPAWYRTWWGVGLIGVAVIGAAAGTAFAIQSGRETEYVFRP